MKESMDGRQLRPFGSWQSPISIETIFNQPAPPTYPFRHRGILHWLQALPQQGGRIALMRQAGGEEDQAAVECLTPEPFNIRSKVHEYGGCCFCIHGDEVVFNNFSDGRLYRQPLDRVKEPTPLTKEDEQICGFADLISVPKLDRIIAVIERLRPGKENLNALIAVDMNADGFAQPETLVSSADFYACPRVGPAQDRLIWIEWNHPMMPWDQSALCAGELQVSPTGGGDQLHCVNRESLIDHADCSVSQAGILGNGDILFARDSEDANWSNLSLFDIENNVIRSLTDTESEFGEAHWVFGQRRWVETENGSVFAVATDHQGDTLYRIELANSVTDKRDPQIEPLMQSAGLSQLGYSDGKVQLIESAADRTPEVIELALDADGQPPRRYRTDRTDGEDSLDPISIPQPLGCATRDGEQTWGYLYRPVSARYRAPEGTLPPLVVMVHGGPTSRTNRSYQPLKQYFASLGFAVLDINHRGSTGYGRAYRQRLLGGWGEVDAMDIADCIRYLCGQREVDVDAVFIRGGSAGGYAVLRALTVYPDLFAGGACYYGIGNLITLSEITHKFESRYTDRLIGEPFDPERAREPASRYRSRSPIFDMDKLTAPLILFQGLLDNVVPPEVSREVVATLGKRGIEHAYTEYDNEGHGFRITENRVDSLRKETGFFTEIVSGSPS